MVAVVEGSCVNICQLDQSLYQDSKDSGQGQSSRC